MAEDAVVVRLPSSAAGHLRSSLPSALDNHSHCTDTVAMLTQSHCVLDDRSPSSSRDICVVLSQSLSVGVALRARWIGRMIALRLRPLLVLLCCLSAIDVAITKAQDLPPPPGPPPL